MMATLSELEALAAAHNIEIARVIHMPSGAWKVLFCYHVATNSEWWGSDKGFPTEHKAINHAHYMIAQMGENYMNLLKDTDLFAYLTGDMFKKPMQLTIKGGRLEKMKNDRGEEDKPVLYFRETKKGLVLNKTAAKTLHQLFGTWDVDEMIGQKVTLYSETGQAFGKQYNAARISSELPREPKLRSAEKAEAATEQPELVPTENAGTGAGAYEN